MLTRLKNVIGIAQSPGAIAGLVGALCLVLWVATGCATTQNLPQIQDNDPADTSGTNSLSLHEGDVLQITFPSYPEWSGPETVRADGKITIQNFEVKVSGLTPEAAGQAILGAVGDQLKIKQVNVIVQSSAFIVYVTGSVLRPGKIISDRPVTVFQAIIDAGIDPAKSNLKNVEVIREYPNGDHKYKFLNLQDIIDGRAVKPFTVKAYDTIVVKEKFSPW